MLYRASEKKLSQNFAFIIDKKVPGGYEITSKNFFTCDDTFEVFGKNHDLINDIKITGLFDVKADCEVDRVNKPMYKYIVEMDIGEYVFTKLFASRILIALASLRNQATQEELHNIDLTTDDLMDRARLLRREVEDLLRSTISFSSMAPE